ncbi:MAG: DRTGG domain-containing protein [Eubacteriales bacterium]|nr:DRTGG domain-containing protein [Eubacteriales bacterium]
MRISEVAEILKCDLVCGAQNLDKPLSSACGADLMSDVLAFAKDGCVLLTGMVNQHVIRTAEMLDVLCIVFVRGKMPSDDICALAETNGITLLCCKSTLYEACGILYTKGLPPCSRL